MPAGRIQQRPIGLCRRHGRAAELSEIEKTTHSGFIKIIFVFNISNNGKNVANVANVGHLGYIFQ